MTLRRRYFAATAIVLVACGGTTGPSFDDGSGSGTPGAADAAANPGSNGGGGGNASCPACVTDGDCASGSVCAQFSGDTFCAPACPNGNECSSDRACSTVTSASGQQVDVCVPRGDVCGPSVGPGEPSDGGVTTPPPDGGTPGQTCGSLAGPSVPAKCNSCGSHTCQANGCYGGWYCNTTTNKCQSPPSSCGTPPPSGDAGGGVPPSVDAGGPVTGTIGNGGGTESRLYFAIVGDTRPATIDDTSGYPTAIITKIFEDLAAASPMPPFLVSTGDYMFASTTKGQAAPQLDLYLGAKTKYSGVQFPTMGNHECTGMTASNCGPGTTDGTTDNYNQFLSKMLAPIGQQNPYYRIDIAATDASWKAKFLFVAGNAWNTAQATWLDTQMADPTTYTFIVRHEPASATTAPGVTPSEQIMKKYPYTLAIVGHTHTYSKSGAKEVIIGNGGAPLTSGGNYGYGLVTQRPDLSIQINMIDYQTGQPVPNFQFALKPDGTPAP